MHGRLVPRTPAWEKTKKRQLQLLTSLLFEAGMPGGTVRFFAKCHELFTTGDEYNTEEMAAHAGIVKQSASRHVERLTDFGILRRNNYRSWSLNDEKIAELNRRLM